MNHIGERALFCPRCNSTNIGMYAGGITGTYFCRDCGYMGTLIIEKDFVKTMDSGAGKKSPSQKKIIRKK
jgi:late competence protein required for DNA uptake (superfamily II DNA/RNA helicase)